MAKAIEELCATHKMLGVCMSCDLDKSLTGPHTRASLFERLSHGQALAKSGREAPCYKEHRWVLKVKNIATNLAHPAFKPTIFQFLVGSPVKIRLLNLFKRSCHQSDLGKRLQK